MNHWIESTITYIGCVVLGMITTTSLILTVHLIWTITHTSTKKAVKIFHGLCLLLHIVGVMELTVQLILYIDSFIVDHTLFNGTGSGNPAFVNNILDIVVDFLHAFNIFLISIIFIIRLGLIFKGSIYDYPVLMYKLMIGFCILNIVSLTIGFVVNGTNEIIQEKQAAKSNYDNGTHLPETTDWYIKFLPSFFPTVLLSISMGMYIIQQILLVLLIRNGFKKVSVYPTSS